MASDASGKRSDEVTDTDTRRNILVVDDDRPVLATLAEGLRVAGYRLTGATGG